VADNRLPDDVIEDCPFCGHQGGIHCMGDCFIPCCTHPPCFLSGGVGAFMTYAEASLAWNTRRPALLAARDAERDAARLMWLVDRMDTIDCIDIFGSLEPSPARVRAAIDAALQADAARAGESK
jgi:hypothetical protein